MHKTKINILDSNLFFFFFCRLIVYYQLVFYEMEPSRGRKRKQTKNEIFTQRIFMTFILFAKGYYSDTERTQRVKATQICMKINNSINLKKHRLYRLTALKHITFHTKQPFICMGARGEGRLEGGEGGHVGGFMWLSMFACS